MVDIEHIGAERLKMIDIAHSGVEAMKMVDIAHIGAERLRMIVTYCHIIPNPKQVIIILAR